MRSRRPGVAAATVLVAVAGTVPGCGGSRHETTAFVGHARGATLRLAVVARRPDVTAWALSIRFGAGERALRRVVTRTPLEAFCYSPGLLVDAGIGPSDVRGDGLLVTRFLNLPQRKRWLCGLHDAAGSSKNLRDYVATAALAATLTPA